MQIWGQTGINLQAQTGPGIFRGIFGAKTELFFEDKPQLHGLA